MKKFLLLLLILVVQPAVTRITAQSLLTDGKVWNCVTRLTRTKMDKDNKYYSIAVIGDTVVNGMECRLMEQRWANSSRTHRFAAIEKDSRLYNVGEEGGLHELLNFDLKIGETDGEVGGVVVSVDTINVRGINRKRIVIENGNLTQYVVEGIGISDTDYRQEEFAISSHESLLSVTENGEVIFTAADFAPCYPEGTKWTEIRVDTQKYDSWYSQEGEEWIPNFETVDYIVKEEQAETYPANPTYYRNVYTNGPDWTDSLTFLLLEDSYTIFATVRTADKLWMPAQAYKIQSFVKGRAETYQNLVEEDESLPYYYDGNHNDGLRLYGGVKEIQTEYLGGTQPLTCVTTNRCRIIQGIGVTEWPDGECLFGPVGIYEALYGGNNRNYRSMLVYFERNGETLYDVWPQPGQSWLDVKAPVITSKKEDSNAIYDLQGRQLNAVPQKGLYIRNGKKCEIKP